MQPYYFLSIQVAHAHDAASQMGISAYNFIFNVQIYAKK